MSRIRLLSSIVLLTAAGMAVVNSAMAQTYFHSPGDTIIATAVFNDVNVYNITQVHTTTDTLYFRWYKESAAMPATWQASICSNGNCYTSLVDSGMMIPIVPGDNGLMSLHLDPGNEPGTGVVRYRLIESGRPLQADTLTWIITAGTAAAIPETIKEDPQVLFGHKQVECQNQDGRYTEAFLYDSGGRLLLHQQLLPSKVTISLAGYGASVLILKLSGKRHFIKKILND